MSAAVVLWVLVNIGHGYGAMVPRMVYPTAEDCSFRAESIRMTPASVGGTAAVCLAKDAVPVAMQLGRP